MNSADSKLTALQFNEYINRRDIDGLASLMTEDHQFIDRAGKIVKGEVAMTKSWIEFFESFPEYRNTFLRVDSHETLVVLYGYATWSKGLDPDCAIWTAGIANDLVSEWRIYEDSEENKRKLGLLEPIPAHESGRSAGVLLRLRRSGRRSESGREPFLGNDPQHYFTFDLHAV